MRTNWLLFTAAAQALDCSRSYPGPQNPNFETGTLEGWTVLSGDAFGDASVSNSSGYFDGSFHQNGNYFLWGYQKAGDGPVGMLRSSTFQASSVMSFLVGGGYNPEKLYIGLVRESDGTLLLKQTGVDDESLIRIVWDTSAWAGEQVYMVAVDEVDGRSWGHINLDDVRTGCDALGDGGLTFTIMGQSNQPSSALSSQSACELYGADPTRPQYHYTPYQGWINDPCGLIQWKGQHHRFAQFNPRSAVWDSMHWSHAVSDDGVHWKPLPIAMYPPYPDDLGDQSGRYTGSAVTDPSSGDLRLLFTEFTVSDKHPGAVGETQWTATSSDGFSFSYFSGNPVIPGPPSDSQSGFRDPKIFWDDVSGTWRAVVGSGDSRSGKIQLYEANNGDLQTWNYIGVLFEGDGSSGGMWECPNFFPLDGKWVLFYGANGKMMYNVGSYNGNTFTSETSGLVDYGPAGYAGQWYKDDKGRNLAVSWMTTMGGWKMPSRVNGWVGQHSFTRELFINGQGKLGSRPMDEIKLLESSSGPVSRPAGTIEQETSLGRGNMLRLRFAIDFTQSSATAFTIRLFTSSAEAVKIVYTATSNTLSLDTTNAGYGQAGVWNADVVSRDGKLQLEMLLDRSSLEIFAGDGTAMSATVFPRYQESNEITIAANDGRLWLEQFEMHELGSGWC